MNEKRKLNQKGTCMHTPYKDGTRIQSNKFLFQKNHKELNSKLSFLIDSGQPIVSTPIYKEMIENEIIQTYQTEKKKHFDALLFCSFLAILFFALAIKCLTGSFQPLHRVIIVTIWGGIGFVILLSAIQNFSALRICKPSFLKLSHAVQTDHYLLLRYYVLEKQYYSELDCERNQNYQYFLKFSDFTVQVSDEIFHQLKQKDSVTVAILQTSNAKFFYLFP